MIVQSFKVRYLSLVLILFIIMNFVFVGLASGNFYWSDAPTKPKLITINNDGSISPESASIQKAGSVYTFTEDIFNSSLIIKADNVIVDGAGFSLEGTGHNSGYLNRGFYEGISVVDLTNITLRNFVVRSFDFGVMIANSSGILLCDCKIFETLRICNSSYACQLAENELSRVELQSSHNLVTLNNFTLPNSHLHIEGNNNQITNNICNASIRVASSQNNQISNNTVLAGIEICASSSYNAVFANQIIYSCGAGLTVHNSFENYFYNNTMKNCQIGILLSDEPPSWGYANSADNLFYQNSLINNTKNAYFSQVLTSNFGFNFWDNNKTGNYYSDYNGTDANGDGIGDTPYVISLNNQDNYPLMKPLNPEDIDEPAADAEPVELFPISVLFVACAVPIAAVCLGLTIYLKKKRENSIEAS